MTDELIKIRRYLHANPELSFEESNTSHYISTLLYEWGIDHKSGIGGYGIVGVLEGKNPDKKIIALRADMDALPIQELNAVDYKSLNEGVMHACGHDVHMTCLLGALKYLNQNLGKFEGSIKFIFQPAEEMLPGGAIKMIEEGVLENPKPELIIAQHVFPELEAGKLGFKSGIYMASSDEINLKVIGRGGHAAIPERYDYTVMAASKIMVKLYEVVQDEKPKDFPSVLAFGEFLAKGAYNVIPSEVNISGTFRTFNEDWRRKFQSLIIEISTQVANEFNCLAEVNIKKGYPVLVNNKAVTEASKEFSKEIAGDGNVEELKIRTTVEDFARFAEIVPACFYRLGIANKEKGIVSNLHTNTFNVDESAIETGVATMIWLAVSHLSK
ncbi:MAG: amidohydrolase [Marinilabiliales bacterium]|nr:MAG: amidohydrolase [Marinilabiliales bacterium]